VSEPNRGRRCCRQSLSRVQARVVRLCAELSTRSASFLAVHGLTYPRSSIRVHQALGRGVLVRSIGNGVRHVECRWRCFTPLTSFRPLHASGSLAGALLHIMHAAAGSWSAPQVTCENIHHVHHFPHVQHASSQPVKPSNVTRNGPVVH
jgi:hypothetical protein